MGNEERFLYDLSRLFLYAESKHGEWDETMELMVFDLIENHQSRRRTLWHYFRLIVTEWWQLSVVVNVRWYTRLWWLRYARRMSDGRIADLFEQEEQQANQAFLDALQAIVKGKN
ncbi:MAG TPA: hypothetical protein PLD20_13040 [Blastocatellia bacterium]|nr:hypothetical protein [Blastocatellia bacterium]HMX25563.1 hypothetical protein [Blastocatellia bacterium]HMY70297.1 hypothetical protein [Blastocatellia bacterium]HMZ18854.1 hypothetical protein [Blastocatellia bacterium]HNG31822.1 hypothetical protein [Blastocatellia bacterium]